MKGTTRAVTMNVIRLKEAPRRSGRRYGFPFPRSVPTVRPPIVLEIIRARE
jgi:hypothetical protein